MVYSLAYDPHSLKSHSTISRGDLREASPWGPVAISEATLWVGCFGNRAASYGTRVAEVPPGSPPPAAVLCQRASPELFAGVHSARNGASVPACPACTCAARVPAVLAQAGTGGG